jgi:monofunctional biosynthetic peptidoglycan transglycosylase
MTTNFSTPLRQFTMLAWACLTLTMNAETASDKILFDFATATNSSAWQIVNDDVMGGVSTSRFEVFTNGAVFSGAVSLENNGGFASVRSSPVRRNLIGFDAFVIRVRGDGHRYKFTVRTETGFDTPIYQCAFTTRRGEWEEHRLPFKDFVPTFRGRVLTDAPPLNPAKVSTVGFLIADNQDGPFRLEITSIRVGK